MSFIETALNRAKDIGRNASGQGDRPQDGSRMKTKGSRSRRRVVLDADTLAARQAQARPRRPAGIDKATYEKHGVILGHRSDDRAERAYRILRTRIQHRLEAQGWSSIGVTSATPGEGKTLTAINLSIALARDPGTWVTLVDLDLQRPKVASYLGMSYPAGLGDFLAGQAELDDITYSIGVDRLTIVPNAHAIDYSSDILGSPRVSELCAAVRAEQPQHIVVYDLPPVLVSDDVLRFVPHMDAVLFMVAEGLVSRSALKRASEAMRGVNLLGLVLNRSAETQMDLYYY